MIGISARRRSLGLATMRMVAGAIVMAAAVATGLVVMMRARVIHRRGTGGNTQDDQQS
jgi:hypothetical protein